MINKFYEFFRSKVNDNNPYPNSKKFKDQENDLNDNNIYKQSSQEIKVLNNFGGLKEINTLSFSQNSKNKYFFLTNK